MPPSERNTKIVIIESGNRCAFSFGKEICNEVLAKENDGGRVAFIGDIAHIKGENEGSARYDENMEKGERNNAENLMVLCKNHHKTIDDQEDIYTVEVLLEMKNNHRKWIIEKTNKALPDITFIELATVTQFLIRNTSPVDVIEGICPKDKIKKNGLSAEVENQITMGMSRVKLVQDYISQSLDSEFGEKLKQGFIAEYCRLISDEKLQGDDIFDSFLDFASNSSSDFKSRAAGLAVLTYFFEQCDIFEK